MTKTRADAEALARQRLAKVLRPPFIGMKKVSALVKRIDVVVGGKGNLGDLLMPSGKKLAECTGDDARDALKAILQAMALHAAETTVRKRQALEGQ